MLIWSKQKRMLEESESMIADTNKRLGAAVQDLRELIVGFVSSRSPFHRPPLLIVHATDTI